MALPSVVGLPACSRSAGLPKPAIGAAITPIRIRRFAHLGAPFPSAGGSCESRWRTRSPKSGGRRLFSMIGSSRAYRWTPNARRSLRVRPLVPEEPTWHTNVDLPLETVDCRRHPCLCGAPSSTPAKCSSCNRRKSSSIRRRRTKIVDSSPACSRGSAGARAAPTRFLQRSAAAPGECTTG